MDVGVHFNKLPKQTAPSSVLCMSGFRQRIGSINLGCSSGVRVPKTPGARIVGLKVHPTSTQGRKNPPRSAIASHSVIFAEIGTIKMGIDAAAAAAGGGVGANLPHGACTSPCLLDALRGAVAVPGHPRQSISRTMSHRPVFPPACRLARPVDIPRGQRSSPVNAGRASDHRGRRNCRVT